MKYLMALILIFVVTSCGTNLLPIGDSDSESSRLESAKVAIDDGKYDEAISSLFPLDDFSADNLNEARKLYASAYAAKSGFKFLSIIDRLMSSTGETSDPITMMYGYKARIEASDIENLRKAQNALYAISEHANERSVEENYLLALVSAYKVAALIQYSLSNTAYASLPGSTINPCQSDIVPDDRAKEILAGYNISVSAMLGQNGDFFSAIDRISITGASVSRDTSEMGDSDVFIIRNYVKTVIMRKGGSC